MRLCVKMGLKVLRRIGSKKRERDVEKEKNGQHIVPDLVLDKIVLSHSGKDCVVEQVSLEGLLTQRSFAEASTCYSAPKNQPRPLPYQPIAV